MISRNGNDISFIGFGSRVINIVYKGVVVVWQNIVGWWVNDRPWNNDQPWRNE